MKEEKATAIINIIKVQKCKNSRNKRRAK